jgi:cell division protein FtsL
MATGTFEFVIKKDVRNNPIVREVDRKRHREMWRAILVGGGIVATLLFSAWQHFELIHHGYRIEAMQRERLVQDEINGHLRLEIETLRSPARIERLATGRLHMVAPGPEDATVVERVRSAAPPSKSIVALR